MLSDINIWPKIVSIFCFKWVSNESRILHEYTTIFLSCKMREVRRWSVTISRFAALFPTNFEILVSFHFQNEIYTSRFPFEFLMRPKAFARLSAEYQNIFRTLYHLLLWFQNDEQMKLIRNSQCAVEVLKENCSTFRFYTEILVVAILHLTKRVYIFYATKNCKKTSKTYAFMHKTGFWLH